MVLHDSENWASSTADLQLLCRIDRFMILWIYRVKPDDNTFSAMLHKMLGIVEVSSELRFDGTDMGNDPPLLSICHGY